MNRLDGLALCWRIERADGAGLALTSHDRALTVDGTLFEPSPGLLPAAIHRSGGLTPGSAEIDGSIRSSALTDDDLQAGRWNGARYHLDLVDWSDGGTVRTNLAAGEMGSIAVTGDGFTADLTGPAAALDEAVCPVTSSECRAAFGSRACRVDLSSRRRSAVLVGASGNRVVTDPPISTDEIGGRFVVLGGAQTGWQSVVLGLAGEQAILRDAPWKPLEAGTPVWIEEGCDKRFATCRDRFGNADNFRGEPYLPGNDLLTRYPGG